MNPLGQLCMPNFSEFPDMRGFKAEAVFKDKLFDGKLET